MLHKMRRMLRRRHRLNQQMVDALGWRHPRPSADPRLVGMQVALSWVAFVQCLGNPAPSSVQAQAFSQVATLAFSALLIVSSALVVYAGFCKSQYWSFGMELAGCIGQSFTFGIYSLALVSTIQDWHSSTGAAWAFGFFGGNIIRAGILAWRLW